MFESAENLLGCARAFAALHPDEKPSAFDPAARPSHICLRTGSRAEFDAACAFAPELGLSAVRAFKGREILWIRLFKPVPNPAGGRYGWLEVLAPPNTGSCIAAPAKLVYAAPDLPLIQIALPGQDDAQIVQQPLTADAINEQA